MLPKDNLYTFDEEDIVIAPSSKGVYSLYKAGEVIYIGKAESEGGIRERLLSHLHGEELCTKQATAYRCEVHDSPSARERELLLEYRLAHGRLPVCNERID